MHDAIWWLADPSNPDVSPPGSIVGLLIITVPTTITALALLIPALRKRNRPQDDPPAPLPLPATAPNVETSRLRKENTALRRWLERNGFDPDKIKRGTEAVDSVRIRP